MKPKIIFFLNSIQQQRCIKRIDEFITNGYEIEAYGFARGEDAPTKPTSFKITIIGEISNTLAFGKRFCLMRNSMKKILKQYKGQNVIFYYFLLDVAIAARSISSHRYIYENSDLMYGYFKGLKRKFFELIDKWIIKKSIISVFTSEGFLEYLFNGKNPGNIYIAPNKINKRILNLEYNPSPINVSHLRFSFVGFVRQPAVLKLAEVIGELFPQHEFHVYGLIKEDKILCYQNLAKNFPNIILHGPFSNPDDLPNIYKETDIIVSAIGNSSKGNLNILYAEPNKLYESIYFRKPIIVPEGTFLSRKVQRLGIGYCLTDISENGIKNFISNLTDFSIEEKMINLNRIDRIQAVDSNPQLYSLLQSRI